MRELVEQGLGLQVALLLCQAIEAENPTEFISDNIQYHNITEAAVQISGPCRFLFATSDGRIVTSSDCKTQPKLEPTVYLVLPNAVHELTGCDPTSIANHYCAQSPAELATTQGTIRTQQIHACMA